MRVAGHAPLGKQTSHIIWNVCPTIVETVALSPRLSLSFSFLPHVLVSCAPTMYAFHSLCESDGLASELQLGQVWVPKCVAPVGYLGNL